MSVESNFEGPEESFVEQKVTYSLEVDGRFVIVEHVPARVSLRTGERLFSPATVERIQSIVSQQKRPVRIVESPVFEYEDSAARSVEDDSGKTMALKRYELGSLLFKCLGIFLILLGIENGASVLFYFILSFGQHLDWQMASSIAMGLALLGSGLLAIRWSDSLGRKIYPRLPDEPVAGHLGAAELASVVFAGIGVVFIVLAVSWIARYLMILILFLVNTSPNESGYRSQLVSYLGILFRYLCQGFLGAGLFLRAQTLAEWWSRLRDFRDDADESSGEEERSEIESEGGEDQPGLG